MKRTLAYILALVMTVSVMAVGSFALPAAAEDGEYFVDFSLPYVGGNPVVTGGTCGVDSGINSHVEAGGDVGLSVCQHIRGFKCVPEPGLFKNDEFVFIEVVFYWPSDTTNDNTKLHAEVGLGDANSVFTWNRSEIGKVDEWVTYEFKEQLGANKVNANPDGIKFMLFHSANRTVTNPGADDYEALIIKSVRIYKDPTPRLDWTLLEYYIDNRLDTALYTPESIEDYNAEIAKAQQLVRDNKGKPGVTITQADIITQIDDIKTASKTVVIKDKTYILTNAEFKGFDLVDLDATVTGYVGNISESRCWVVRPNEKYMPLYEAKDEEGQGVLDGVSAVTIEVEFMFADDAHGSDRFTIDHPRESGFVTNAAVFFEQADFEGLVDIRYGVYGEWGKVTIEMEDFDNANLEDNTVCPGALLMISNRFTAEVYIKAVRIFATADKEKMVAIEFMPPEVDRTALKTAIDNIKALDPEDYVTTDPKWIDMFKEDGLLAEGEALYEKEFVTRAEIAVMAKRLDDARKALPVLIKVDPAVLQTAIVAGEAFQAREDYKNFCNLSKTNLQTAITDGKAALTALASQDAVNAAAKAINDALVLNTAMRLKGDVDGDGEVKIGDVRILLQNLVEKITSLDIDLIARSAAMVSNSDNYSVTDARIILQYLVGKITAWPA
ncbi:MAG: hypothetical protein FWE80_01435 [Oscillospiraceae bacterium]|nr:hypothetical protein [Oscillospiraceae bacterium]